MTEEKMSPFDALRLSLDLIGLAKIGVIPSARLVKIAFNQLKDLREGELPEFPNALARLGEICGPIPILPSHSACRAACDEISNAIYTRRNPNAKYSRPLSKLPVASYAKSEADFKEDSDYLNVVSIAREFRH